MVIRVSLVIVGVLLSLSVTGAIRVWGKESSMTSPGEASSGLNIRGRVIEVKQVREDVHSIVFSVKLRLEFVNVGKTPVILLSRTFWPGAITLSNSPDDAKANKYVYNSEHWPSVDRSPEWIELRRRLNQPDPPTDLTRIIVPAESWAYKTEATLYIEKPGALDKTSQTWAVIRRAPSVWLQVTLEMWPVNVEPKVNPNNLAFGKMLRHRWQTFGQLQLERMTSEPMQLSFPSPPPQ